MATWIIVTVVVIVLAIVFLSGRSLTKSKTREEYLQELAAYLEGQLSPLTGQTPGYQIVFKFEGRDFIFEDVEQEGFQEKVHKAYLKIKTNSSLTINFTEGSRMTIRSEIVKASDIKDEQIERLMVPKELKKFKVFANDIEKANELFEDPKTKGLFVHYFNTGTRGEPAMALRLQDGLLTLEFFESVAMRPSLYDLMETPAKIENELYNILTLTKLIEAKPAGT